ncbi:MAG: YidC/Oxa1 family membrane protein insertase, partial [Lachnospiraceae bacterium]|nr:YidC/Oxa1 family membrane protein insertase [Lachnospiraceae bacterium]
GLAIIIFTIVLLMAMMPLQVKQQRFSKLNAIMQPEIQKIQAKYKGKKDQVSQQKMMDEMNAVYAKYGVSQMGSCVQMLIQLPVMFALYQVIYKIPGYITIIGDKIRPLASDSAFAEILGKFVADQNSATLTRNFGSGETNNIIDAIYGLTTKQWAALEEAAGGSFSNLGEIQSYIRKATNFFNLSISDSPMDIIRNAWTDKPDFWVVLILAAVAFPLLAWLTQWLTFKLMPQPESTGSQGNDTMNQTMKSMNTFMPMMSAVFCLTLPVGVGIYWIMSAVVRAVQQFVINRRLNKESVEDIIKAAQEKANKKRAKQGLPPQKITNQAHVSTRSFEVEEKAFEARKAKAAEKNAAAIAESTAYYNQNAKPGSLAAKANMVKAFDEKGGKKKK